ncbi:MAG: methyltransferase domain-containing protein [Thermodesulfobacteriota bacterium]
MPERFTKFIERVAQDRPLEVNYFGDSPSLTWDTWRVARLLAVELDRLSLPPPARILDIGCGIGVYERELLERWPEAEIVGLDLSAHNLKIAAGWERRGRYVRADAEQLPFGDASVDLAIALEVMEHFLNPRRVAAECARVLKPGGVLIAAVPLAPPLPFLNAVSALATRFIGSKTVTDGPYKEHMRLYNKRSFRSHFSRGWIERKMIAFNLMTFVVALFDKFSRSLAVGAAERRRGWLDRADLIFGRVVYAKGMWILERTDAPAGGSD